MFESFDTTSAPYNWDQIMGIGGGVGVLIALSSKDKTTRSIGVGMVGIAVIGELAHVFVFGHHN